MSRTRPWIWIVASTLSTLLLTMVGVWLLSAEREADTGVERLRPGAVALPAEGEPSAYPATGEDLEMSGAEPAVTSPQDALRTPTTDPEPTPSAPSAFPAMSRFPVMDPEAQAEVAQGARALAYTGERPMSLREFAESLKGTQTEWPWR